MKVGSSRIRRRRSALENKNGPRPSAEARLIGALERRRFLHVVRFRGIGNGGLNSRLRLAPVELTHDIGANRPRSDLRGFRVLAFAVRLVVGGADEAALDEHVSAFFYAVENGLG